MTDTHHNRSLQRHAEEVRAYIRDAIAMAGGRIGFGRYLELALYAPGLGYYSAGSAKFGPDGDFVTAPEISSLFGAAVAAPVADALAELGGEAVVFELGAGSGRLAADLLLALAQRDALPREYWILEVSADLKARQRATLAALAAGLASRVRWLPGLPERPLTGVVLANEVLDALPFERFRVPADGPWLAAWVEVDADEFQCVFDEPAPELRQAFVELATDVGPLPAGFESEVCPAARAFVFTLAERLARGIMLFGDYGGTRREYYLPERRDGTLICHHRQRANCDPFWRPGLQDISAWVDFTAVASAGVDAGLEVAGYSTQAHFLLGCGLDQILARQVAATPERAAVLHSEAKTLTLPGEMGERFKFLGLSRGLSGRPAAFQIRDLAAAL